MNSAGKYTPLGLNSLGSLLQNQGLCINPEAASYMGSSTNLNNYTKGITTANTCLKMLVNSIRAGFLNNQLNCYSNLINIGYDSIPALGNSKPTTYTRTASLSPYPSNATPYTGEYTSFGWLRTIPLQAHYEFYINNGNYADFLNTFNIASSFIKTSNKAIDAFNTSDTYLDGIYSNMNDLITADLSGVSLALLDFGQELINLGRVIDLSTIDKFGEPVNLLKTLYANKGITKAVNFALLVAGFSSNDVDTMIKTGTASIEQQKRLYAAFSIITGEDLKEVLVTLNCQIANVSVLSSLLDPKVLFPKSYVSLTVPIYNPAPVAGSPVNSKIYYLIYTGRETTSQVVENFGDRLRDMLPDSLAAACDAFSTTMMQVRNIKSMNIEKFSQVVSSLETVSDLNVNGTNVPTNADIASTAKSLVALGTGTKGRYTTCDFFGAMSGITYPWKNLTSLIAQLETPLLYQLYRNLYLAITWKRATCTVTYTTYDSGGSTYYHVTGVNITDSGGGYGLEGGSSPTITISNGGSCSTTIGTDDNDLTTFGKVKTVMLTSSGTDATSVPTATISYPPGSITSFSNPMVLNYINNINAEIRSIAVSNPVLAIQVNSLYNSFGWHLEREQNARTIGLNQERNLSDLASTVIDVYSFMEALKSYSMDTDKEMSAQVLEAITEPNTLAGNSIVGAMREARNSARLSLIGAEQDNGVEEEKLQLPIVSGTISTLQNPALAARPIITGTSDIPGNMSPSSASTLIPPNLDLFKIGDTIKVGVTPIDKAIEDVIACNCDCWDNLQ